MLDSGASQHVTPSRAAFLPFRASENGICITTADGTQHYAQGVGDVRLELVSSTAPVTLTDGSYVPTLRGNLISVSQLARRGIAVDMGAEAASLSRA